MSTPEQKTLRLLLMEIRHEQDVVFCRQRARQFAEALGFSGQAQIRIATALSEIARNTFQYATGGRVEFLFATEPRFATPARPQQSLVIVVRDEGPGIARLEQILEGGYRSSSGLGLGILGARRLMDRVDITTSASGTVVTMRKFLPAEAPTRRPEQVQQIVDDFLRRAPASALEEMQLQNHELISAIGEARTREEEITRINHELAETNAGVLALYDELDTLHQVSLLLASKLELKPLIQSIIDVTTELTNADVGAFYFRSEGVDTWSLYATAGPSRDALLGAANSNIADFFGANFATDGLVHIADLDEHVSPSCASAFARSVSAQLRVRSFLVVPIGATNGPLLGAMVFAAAEKERFTVRSERIVGSIAAQAVVGVEKSRLFQEATTASAAKDQFIAMLSHELRTPLNPVLAVVTSWDEDPRVPEDLRDDMTMIARNIRLEARLIDDLLDFNKLINGKMQIERARVDVHEMVSSVLEICRGELAAEAQQIVVQLDAQCSIVIGDAARLQQILWNVLKNAIKFSPRGGVISIRSSNPVPETLRIEIIDQGRGIEPQFLGHIFGAFDQGSPQIMARFGGLGLGLAIARIFVERHGGSIAAASDGLGHGSSFTIELPLTTDGTAPESSPAASALAPQTRIPARILLIEDHDDTRDTLTRLLVRKGHQVTGASTGALARDEYAKADFDLIISDLGLPDCSGLELIADLHALRRAPAIALSGYGMEADVSSSHTAGFSSHLTKPIDFQQLLAAIDSIMQRSKA